MNYKGHVCMVNKNKFSTLLVKAFKSFQIFPGLPASLGRAVGVLELEGSGWPRNFAYPRREARPRVHLRYRSATARSSDYVPRVNWLEAANASRQVEQGL